MLHTSTLLLTVKSTHISTTTRGKGAENTLRSTRTSRFSSKRNHNTTKSSVSENAKMTSKSHLGDEEQRKRMSTTKNTIDFLSICGKLKQTRRTGWTKYKEITSQVESVADHSFRIALMAFVFGLQQEEDKEEKVLDVQN